MVWAILFLVVGIIFAIWGYGGIAIAVSPLSKTLFYLSGICLLIGLFLAVLWILHRRWQNRKIVKKD